MATLLIILEMLKNENVIFLDLGVNILNNAIIIYIFVQAIALSAQMASVYKENEYLNQYLEKSVEHKTIELSSANNTKSRILSVVTHDLMNPLTNLKGTLNLLELNVLTPEDLKNMKGSMIEQLNQNIVLMEEVLKWSSMELKKDHQPKDVKPAKAFDATETVFRQLQQFALQKSIRLINKVGENTLVQADYDALVIILRNLISNAIKFTETNGKIEVMASISGAFCEFVVKDNGIGIPVELKDKIFTSDDGSTRYGTGDEKGRGVGLLIVKDLVSQNDGKIWVEDNSNEPGTSFKFTLLKAQNNPQ